MIGPGTRLGGRYELTSPIARGGMAEVFEARDEVLGRSVAVKVLHAGSAHGRRFDDEIALLARLEHPNLVRVFDAGRQDDVPYVVLELVGGPTLAQRLGEGPLTVDETAELATSVGGALAYVHARRVVHRDIKPSNILYAADGRPLLADFGVARLLDTTSITTTSATIGTAAYLAPEQALGEPVTPAADVYALGLVLLEALTGRRGFEGTGPEVMMARLSSAPAIPADLPGAWTPLLTAMTARQPADRPDADAVLTAVRSGVAPPDPHATQAHAAVLDDGHDATATLPVVDATRAGPSAGAAAAGGVVAGGVAGAVLGSSTGAGAAGASSPGGPDGGSWPGAGLGSGGSPDHDPDGRPMWQAVAVGLVTFVVVALLATAFVNSRSGTDVVTTDTSTTVAAGPEPSPVSETTAAPTTAAPTTTRAPAPPTTLPPPTTARVDPCTTVDLQIQDLREQRALLGRPGGGDDDDKEGGGRADRAARVAIDDQLEDLEERRDDLDC